MTAIVRTTRVTKPDIAVETILSAEVDTLSGIGPKRSALISNLGISTIEDLLYFFPRRYEDRRKIMKISDLVPGMPSVVFALVNSTERKRLQKQGLSVLVCTLSDETGKITASWFNRRGLEFILKEGTRVALYGVPLLRSGIIEFSNPELEILKDDSDKENLTGIIPIYHSTAGLQVRWFGHFISRTLKEFLPYVQETIPEWIIRKRGLMSLKDALCGMHSPASAEEWKESRRRLVYEEFLMLQTGLAMRRKMLLKDADRAVCIRANGNLYKKFISSLPFRLTDSQRRTLDEIFADTSACAPMSRLLQGDVGSGKTVVAIGFAAAAADAGLQTAVMAPTEVLAGQLFAQCERWLSPLGIRCVFLTAGQNAVQKRLAVESIKNGSALIAVGTQALLDDKVKFENLGAVIIDEQHKFGVMQRASILAGTHAPHLLMMTATPIPRTLSLCLYGDLDISTMRDKPNGRNKIETRLIDFRKMGVLVQFIADEVRAGGRIYWVCPRVDDEGPSEVASVEKRYLFISKHLGCFGAGMLHGRMDISQKDEALKKFRNGEIKILVSTTVLEVGIDVPEASVVVIESPEHFGLSQLHQLRGRVGRGERRGLCVLLVRALSEKISERFKVMLNTCDGFEIAEADLALRGPGEFTGLSQHGVTEFKLADLSKDKKLLLDAREDADEWVFKDDDLSESPGFRDKLKLVLGEALGIG